MLKTKQNLVTRIFDIFYSTIKSCISEIIIVNKLWFDVNAPYKIAIVILKYIILGFKTLSLSAWNIFMTIILKLRLLILILQTPKKHLVIYHWILSKTYFQLEIRNPDPYRHTNRLHVYGVYCECVYYFTWNKYLTHSHIVVKTIQQPHKYSIWYFVFVYHKMIYDQKKNFILKKYMNFKVKKWFSFLLVEEATSIRIFSYTKYWLLL